MAGGNCNPYPQTVIAVSVCTLVLKLAPDAGIFLIHVNSIFLMRRGFDFLRCHVYPTLALANKGDMILPSDNKKTLRDSKSIDEHETQMKT